jgi:hypothetical protein
MIPLYDVPQLVNGAPGVQQLGILFKLLFISRGLSREDTTVALKLINLLH